MSRSLVLKFGLTVLGLLIFAPFVVILYIPVFILGMISPKLLDSAYVRTQEKFARMAVQMVMSKGGMI